jgi:cytochrome c oxidase cbb3-type subunit 4
MYKEVLRTIAGIEVFPLLSLFVFLTVFVVMLVWVVRLDPARLSRYAKLPLEDDPGTTPDVPTRAATHGGGGRS